MQGEEKKYPRDYPEKEIESLIDRYGDTNIEKYNASSYFAKAAIGLAELQRRSSLRSERSSKVFAYWSLAIAVVAIVISIIIPILTMYFTTKEREAQIEIRKNCYRVALQTSDININYTNCLRDHGLGG